MYRDDHGNETKVEPRPKRLVLGPAEQRCDLLPSAIALRRRSITAPPLRGVGPRRRK
jgi:hypothetical protein